MKIQSKSYKQKGFFMVREESYNQYISYIIGFRYKLL